MAAPGRIYISCATADSDNWRRRILTAFAPFETSNTLDLWYREREEDAGGSIDYDAAVLLITQKYFADMDVQRREFRRFIKFLGGPHGLFWIPIEDTIYQLTELGLQNITPVWGFEGGGGIL